MDSQAFSPLRLIRVARRLAQADLATATGVSTSFISNLEAGRQQPTRELLEKLAAVLDCPVEALAGCAFTMTVEAGKVEVTTT